MSLSYKDIHLSYIDNVITIHYHNSYIEILNKLENWSKVDGYDIKKLLLVIYDYYLFILKWIKINSGHLKEKPLHYYIMV